MTPDWSPSNMFDSSMTASNADDTRRISAEYVWQLNDSVKWWWHPTDLRQICLTAQWQRQMVITPDGSPPNMFDSSMTASNGDDTRLISVKYVWQLNDSVKWWWNPTDLRQICLTAQWQRQMVITPDGSPSNMFDSSMTALNDDDTRLISVKYVWQLNDSVKWWWHPTDLRQICLTAQWQRQMLMTPDGSPPNMFDSSMTAWNGDDTRLISVKYVWQLNDSVKWWWHPTDLRQICLTAQWQRQMWWHPTDLRQLCLAAQWQRQMVINPTDLRQVCLTAQWQRQMVMKPDWSPSSMFDSSMTASNCDDTRRISVKYVWQLNDSVKCWWHPTDLRRICLTAQWQREMVMTPDWSPSNMFDSSMTASNGDDTRRISAEYVWQLNDSVKWWWHPTDLRQVCLTAQWQRQMVMTPDGSPSSMFDSSMTASNGDDTRRISVKYVWQLNDSVKWWWHPTHLRQVCLTAQWQRQMVMTPDWSPSNMFDSSMTASNDDDTRRISAEYVWQLNDSVKWWWHPTDLRQICSTAQWQRQMMMTPDWSPSSMFDSSMTASNGDNTRRISVKYVRQLNDSVKWWWHPTHLRQVCLTAQWQRQMVMTPDGSPSSMFDSSMTASNGDNTRRISVKYVWQLNDSVKWWWHPTDLRQICLTAQWQRQMVMTPDWSPSNMFDSSMTASNDDDTRLISVKYVRQLNDSVKWW